MPNINCQKILLLATIILLINGLSVESFNSVQQKAVQINSAQTIRNLQTIVITPQVQIENRVFANLVLYHNVPPTLSNKEIFQVRGRVINPSDKLELNFIQLILQNNQSGQTYQWTQWAKIGFFEFKISIDLRKVPVGQYKALANVGGIKSTAPILINVTETDSSQITQTTPERPDQPIIKYVEDKLTVNWKVSADSVIHKLEFWQAGNIKQFIISNNASSYQIPYTEFADFNTDQVVLTLSQAKSLTQSLTGRNSSFSDGVQIQFYPTVHHFSFYNDTEIPLVKNLPWKAKKGDVITISGIAGKGLKNKITILSPLKTFLHEYFFADKIDYQNVLEGTKVQAKIKLTEQGIYIIEVSNAQGSPALNWPIYIGDAWPLLPQEYDIYNQITYDSKSQPQTIADQKNLLLNLINAKRTEFLVSNLTLEDPINLLAQSYSDSMLKNNFFGHIDYLGLGIQDRAVKAGIKKNIGQNIGLGRSLAQIHHFLARSPSRLEIIVSEQWKTIGLGISKYASGYIIAEEFAGRDYAANPLTKLEIIYYRTQITNLISSKYKKIANENLKLSALVADWQNSAPLYKVLTKLQTYVAKYGFENVFSKTVTVDLYPNFIDQLLGRSPVIIPSKYTATEVGIGLRQVNNYSIEVIVAYV